MRKSTLFTIASCALCGIAVCSCNDKKENLTGDTTSARQTDEQIRILAEKDSLIALFNDISGDMIQLRQMESIVTVPGNLNGESTSTPQIRDDIRAIQAALQQRRERLAELEKKLGASAGENKQLLQMVTNLKAQIAQNETTIKDLTNQLAQANIKIEGLNLAVDSLNTTVADVTTQRDRAEQQSAELTDELNKCYFVIGNKDELRKHKIIETGFLRRTKIMQGDYEQSYFTAADKRTLKSLPLYSKKAKVLTNQPQDSYTITTAADGATKVLNITNHAKFWSAGNYLIVQTD